MEAKRRREETIARTEQFFADLEGGIPLVNLQKLPIEKEKLKEAETEAEDETTIGVSCSLDARLPGGSIMAVAFFPVVQGKGVTSGLLLRLIKGTADHYERLGIFEATHQQLMRFNYPLEEETLVLV